MCHYKAVPDGRSGPALAEDKVEAECFVDWDSVPAEGKCRSLPHCAGKLVEDTRSEEAEELDMGKHFLGCREGTSAVQR